MQFVASRDAREGMCVAEDVCDANGRVLIARGQRLGVHHLVRMRRFRIRSFFIDPTNGETVVKKTRADLREECQQVLGDALGQLRREFATKRVRLDAASINTATDNLLNALMKAKKPLVTLCDVSASSDRLLQHSVNVAVLGIVLAVDLRLPQDLLHDLAVALLFHDVGMIFMPDALVYASRPPTPAQVSTLEQHARLGFEHLVHSEAVSHAACGLILRHHERLDGSGYPQCALGEQLSLPARIVAVAEAYDSLTSLHLGVPAVLPDAAISHIIGRAGTQFAPDVAVALARRIALYPVGTAVQLTTGECGLVAGLLPDMPHRPIILAHTDHRGRTLPQPLIVDLTSDKDRGILRAAPTLDALKQSRRPDYTPPTIDPLYANLG